MIVLAATSPLNYLILRRSPTRRSAGQFFLPDGVILNYEGDPADHQPHSTIKGRAAIPSDARPSVP